jgi:nitroimidazol reductase NimA-like FMN-containing flavoprotein (pyridoxamine 5'-phosphate oxidase superfamily)
MAAVTFSDKATPFLSLVRVGRLAMRDGDGIHLVPMCPVFDGGVFFMATHGRTRKVRTLRADARATLLLDQYSEDWMRNVGVMITGTVDVIEQGAEFDKGKALLEAKFPQYKTMFPIEQGESVVIRFRPTKAVTWDYALGEMQEPH